MKLETVIKEFGYIPLENPTIHLLPFGILKNTNSTFQKFFRKEPIFEDIETVVDCLFDSKVNMNFKSTISQACNFSFNDESKNLINFQDVKVKQIASYIDLANLFYDEKNKLDLFEDDLQEIKNGNYYVITSLLMSNKVSLNKDNYFSKILIENCFKTEDDLNYIKDNDFGIVLGIRLKKLKFKNNRIILEDVNNLKTIKLT